MHETAYVETSFSFDLYRSRLPVGATLGEAAAVYRATMFDVGPGGRVSVGRYALLNGVRILCDAAVEIGDFALISWNVVIMDNYRLPLDPLRRRALLERGRLQHGDARPVRIGAVTWIGFDVCVLPGVTIGDGVVVGARSVVADDVEPFTVVAGNPARAIRRLDPDDPERLARAMREAVAGGREPA
jgi:acetyltransferase-like isoleucine patch superfamily enzyme